MNGVKPKKVLVNVNNKKPPPTMEEKVPSIN